MIGDHNVQLRWLIRRDGTKVLQWRVCYNDGLIGPDSRSSCSAWDDVPVVYEAEIEREEQENQEGGDHVLNLTDEECRKIARELAKKFRDRSPYE